ncbi:MAG: DNA primase [Pirellulales bacterium]|nr:DNA primase [Pirellulales bacterium]
MSLSSLQDAKEQVRQAVDIVDLVGSYMALRRQGRGYVAVCPWHDDSRPSLHVNPERQSFKCWVCDIGGDIFSFLMRIEGLEFRESLEMLADRAGITLAPSRQASGQSSEFERRNLYQAVAWAEEKFHRYLLADPAAEVARSYLSHRGISQDTTERFHLGMAPDRWDWLLTEARQTEWSPAVLERVGLVASRQSGQGYYDRFRRRLMFPIRDTRSRPIAFGGRVLPGQVANDADRPEAKYINSPETPLFSKSSQLYALDLAREGIAREQTVVVMEGYTDVILAHQHGITHAVAVLGTALGEKHVPLLRRFTDRITLVLDGDDAGQKRTMQILDELLALFVSQEIDLRILTLPQGADPCDVIASQGSESFRHQLSTAVDALEHKIVAVTNGLASAPTTHASAQAVEAILDTLARGMPSASSATSTALVREQQVMSRLSRQFGVAEETLRTRLVARRHEITARQHTARVGVRDRAGEAATVPPSRIQLSHWERELIELLIHHADVVPLLADRLDPAQIENPFCRRTFQDVVRLYRGGQTPSFEQLILATDDSAEKNVLVECDERGREKVANDARQRAIDLLDRLDEHHRESRRNQQKAVFHKKSLHPKEEDKQLSQFFKELMPPQKNDR